MSSTTIRIRSTSRQKLQEIADAAGQSLQDALDEAIEERRRTLYLEGVNADYAALSSKARADFDKEIAAWDATDRDGLEGK